MDESDPREQIARLEARIEELADMLERCRKVVLISKTAIAIGGALMVAIAAGLIRSDPVAIIGAIAAIIGGTVLLGSNSTTAEQTTSALQAAEAHRAELIDGIELTVVGDTRDPRPPARIGRNGG